MGMFDFLKAKKENKWAKHEEETQKEAPKKKDLGVCVPVHARPAEERKKLRAQKEVSPFDKLRIEHEKETAQFNREFKDISEQEQKEDGELEADLGVANVEVKKENQATFRDDSSNGEEEKDELDIASEKFSQGFVPKFSATARKKLGIETVEQEAPRTAGSFEVSGMYIGAESMLSGTVVSGKVRKNMTVSLSKGLLRVSDVKKGSLPATELNEGEEGTLFVRGNINTVKNGDVLDFS